MEGGKEEEAVLFVSLLPAVSLQRQNALSGLSPSEAVTARVPAPGGNINPWALVMPFLFVPQPQDGMLPPIANLQEASKSPASRVHQN